MKFNWKAEVTIRRAERIRTDDPKEKLPARGLPFLVEFADHRYRLNENLITLVIPVERGSETRKVYNWYSSVLL